MATAPQSRWAAFYFDGETPTRHEVAAVIMHQGIEIHRSDGSTLWWRHDEIRRTHGALSGQHVRLERVGQSVRRSSSRSARSFKPFDRLPRIGKTAAVLAHGQTGFNTWLLLWPWPSYSQPCTCG